MGISNAGQIEVSDNEGRSEAFSGTATTSVTNIPSSAGQKISEALVAVDGNNVQISFDGGTSFWDVPKKAAFAWDVKGEITQIQIKTSSGSTDYSILVNFEVD